MVSDSPHDANATDVQPLEFADMQGLLVSAFAHLPCVAYMMLRVTDRRAARAWLAAHRDLVTPAVRKQEQWSLNVAFTLEGLEALGLPAESLASFPTPMHDGGMASERRSRILGDRGPNAPSAWEWGGPGTEPVHILLIVFGEDDGERDARVASMLPTAGAGLTEVLTLRAGRQPDSREHFGFADGVGQPVVAGTGRRERQLARTLHATEIAAGEFVLGYCNEDGALPISPTIPRAALGAAAHALKAHASGELNLGENGTFLVFRQLKQDVSGFWTGVRAEAENLWPGDATAAERLAAKMVGRWESGAPLVRYPDADPYGGEPQTVTENNFSYAEQDSAGEKCPLGSHIRRCNPRDALGPDAAQALESSRRHRLLRRGRSYGDQATDRYANDGVDRGLHFICLNADLERQFEFVQQTWVNNSGFALLSGEVDPIVGAPAGGSCPFSIQGDPVRVRVHGIQPHVTVKGGAYWFLPGLRAIRAISAIAD